MTEPEMTEPGQPELPAVAVYLLGKEFTNENTLAPATTNRELGEAAKEKGVNAQVLQHGTILTALHKRHGDGLDVVMVATDQLPPHDDDTIVSAEAIQPWLEQLCGADNVEVVVLNSNPTSSDRRTVKSIAKALKGPVLDAANEFVAEGGVVYLLTSRSAPDLRHNINKIVTEQVSELLPIIMYSPSHFEGDERSGAAGLTLAYVDRPVAPLITDDDREELVQAATLVGAERVADALRDAANR